MFRKLVIISLLIRIVLPVDLHAQAKSPFTGDPVKYKEELTAYMGPNLKDDQKANLNEFLSNWDSLAFGREDMTRIIDLTSQFYGRSMRPVPYINNFLTTVNTYVRRKFTSEFLSNWLIGLSEMTFNRRITTEIIDRYIKNSELMITENVLSQFPALRWKVKNSTLKFMHDTVFKVIVTNATLTCISLKDSTEIYNASGTYFPETLEFHGTSGLITWEKAGYARKDVFAEIKNYIINTTKNFFTVDSALLTHSTYFKTPVYGLLTDQANTIRDKEKSDYPRFETYTKEFLIKGIYEGINYQGGLDLEGSTVKGSGSGLMPAKITIFRKDSLAMTIKSAEFIFTRIGFTGSETSVALYLGADSVYHSNLSFSYNGPLNLVNLYRPNNPLAKSPYYNSYHKLDMYFELLSWNLKEPKVILTRARGASLGQAQFESASFFDSNFFMQLAGIDDYHPLARFRQFAEWYYSETFPVEEFAKWLNRPVEAVTGLCIDMANKGFIFYDRKYNEITLKKKVNDFLDSYAKKKDYDVLRIFSETKAPVDNAILDLNDYRMTINGVAGVYLSDSQRVAIYPSNRQIVIGKNRDMDFDGVVEAGLFTVFGHDFSFNYDTFKISLSKIDSIRISVETEEKDIYGNPVIRSIDNLIQMTTAELYIDDPNNKSGLKSLKQYPIINDTTHSYIYYDQIPGLENIYTRDQFYFKIDPFTYENIDHFTIESLNMEGEFTGGNILKPRREDLVIKENKSLGFDMIVPESGVDLYETKGMAFDSLSLSSDGLTGKGRMKYLNSTITSNDIRLFPDSVLANSASFTVEEDASGRFPPLAGEKVTIRWLTKKDELYAEIGKGESFVMFNNGTRYEGNLKLTSSSLTGSGIINTSDSRITSDNLRFTNGTISADTSDYFLKSASTGGYAFIAENTSTHIDFNLKTASFHLNTDTSMVKFPEIQYICTMTDFVYNMDTKVLNMEQKGQTDRELLSRDKLIRLDFSNLDKPTFLATNVVGDTLAFSSLKGSYHLDGEYIVAENVNYIHIADALIQPEDGKVTINRRAKIDQLQNATIAVNNNHLLHSAKITIESTKKYSGSAVSDYADDNGDIHNISFSEVTVDTMVTSARGYIPVSQNFILSSAFTFTGDVNLYANKNQLLFTGAAGIIQLCDRLKSYPVKFKSFIDPKNVMIPTGDKPRDVNDNLIYSGSYVNVDSLHIYPAFLSEQKSWADIGLVNANGYLYFEKAKNRYVITSLEKIADPTLNGGMLALDKDYCILSGEGRLNFGTNFDLAHMAGAGKVIHQIDSGKVEIQALLGFDFHFSAEALAMMSDKIRLMPTLKPVNLNSELNNKGMKDLLGVEAANLMKEDLNLFGAARNLPKEFNYELFLNDVTLYWNEPSSSFRSKGRIGIGFIGNQPLNLYVDGFIEIQRRRSGDIFDIYLKADESTWYYFSYVRGNMMVQSADITFNTFIAKIKQRARKHPDSSLRVPYTFMISVEDRLTRFLRRMAGEAGMEPDIIEEERLDRRLIR